MLLLESEYIHGHLGNCKKWRFAGPCNDDLFTFIFRAKVCIFMSIFTNDLKTIQAAFVTFIRQNGANKFNMAIKSSGHDRVESWS